MKYPDLTGQQFGRLTVVQQRASMWLCRCSCGRETLTRRWSLTAGRTRSCGCLLSETASSKGRARLRDLTGQRFGRLTVIERAPNLYDKTTAWMCKCDCGESAVVAATSLRVGSTNSCGCLRRNDHAVITYEAAHWRVRQAEGPAYAHVCVDCGWPASQWSYDYSDPTPEHQPGKGFYSLDPDRYEPRCPPCHRDFDLAHKTPRRVASVNVSTY